MRLLATLLTSAGILVPAHASDLLDIVETPPIETHLPELRLGGYTVTAKPEYGRVITDDQDRVTDKALFQLESKLRGTIETNTVYVSGSAKGKLLLETTNTAGKFPILSRFPHQHGGTEGSRFILSNAVGAVTGNLGEWLTLYGQLELTDINFDDHDELQVRRAYALVGNLERTPFYAKFGRDVVDFGDMDAFNPFTHTVNNHFYRVESETPAASLGFANDNFHLVGTALTGGRHLRVADSPEEHTISNFAVDGTARFVPVDGVEVQVGAGYLHGTIYNAARPHHTRAEAAAFDRSLNPAYDLNARLTVGPVELMAEYTTTVDDWPTTRAPVQALTVQGRYNFEAFGKTAAVSAVYSRGDQGPEDSEFEQLEQMVAGLEIGLSETAWVGVEYVRNTGFVPLAVIQFASDKDVVSDSILAGFRVAF